MAYATLAEVKELLAIPPEQTGDDGLLARMIGEAQALVDTYCDRVFEASATVRRFDALRDVVDGTDLIIPRGLDLASVTTIVNGDGVTISPSAYVVLPKSGPPYHLVRLTAAANTVWTWSTAPEDAIAITGVWAWSAAAPSVVASATRLLAQYLYRRRDTHGDMVQPATGDVAVLAARLPADVRAMLDPLRRRY